MQGCNLGLVANQAGLIQTAALHKPGFGLQIQPESTIAALSLWTLF